MPPAKKATLPTRESLLAEKLSSVRTRMLESSQYLGDRSVRDQVIWQRQGRCDVVVAKSDALAMKQALKDREAALQDPALPAPPPPLAPVPAILSAVVLISDDDFWLVSCGNWRGPNVAAPTLADVKLTCVGGAPEAGPFATEFSEVITNIGWLLEQAATKGFKQKSGLLHRVIGGELRLKLRHVLFEELEVKSGEGNCSETESDSDENETGYTINNWPVRSAEARDALREMKDTHRVIPVPAYDLQGKLIAPTEYRSQLAGAVVELYFNLSHWSIGSKDGKEPLDIYVPDILSMRILLPAKRTAPSPRKRKTMSTDPMNSPSKKKACV